MRRSLWRVVFPFYMPLKHLPTVKKHREQVLFVVCAVTPADGIPLAVQICRTHAVAEQDRRRLHVGLVPETCPNEVAVQLRAALD